MEPRSTEQTDAACRDGEWRAPDRRGAAQRIGEVSLRASMPPGRSREDRRTLATGDDAAMGVASRPQSSRATPASLRTCVDDRYRVHLRVAFATLRAGPLVYIAAA
ncbi:hypothetical protein [Nannocystis bainbridge]|uniref:Uncharacterized protein n=1 Tax=Nannocystis bainbridge TaxID=2995303 RepID=A0ABT5DYE8_9BACT|nr:hypothetical protein [Nannocystis bainbridge]MDC0718175.1 hypothetical protein [Nannocystis bainbridge]